MKLRKIRESLGFTLEEVAARCGWAPTVLRRIEHDPEDISDAEAALLGDAYGVDVLDALDAPNKARPPASLRALLKACSETLDAGSRFAITEAAAVARDASELRRALQSHRKRPAFASFKSNPDYTHPSAGIPEQMAKAVRERMGLGDAPVPSLTELAVRLDVQLMVADLASEIDAVSFAHGGVAAIVLNRRGDHNQSAFGRRVTLAHELCHVLFDRNQMREMRSLCQMARPGKANETPSKFHNIERRARAFAVSLLAPEPALRAAWSSASQHEPHARVRLMMEQYGLGYEAIRAQLHNAELLPLNHPLHQRVQTTAPDAWEQRDGWPIHAAPELDAVPVLRRGAFLEVVCEAWSGGVLAESGAREALRVPYAQWGSVAPALIALPARPRHALGWHTSASVRGLGGSLEAEQAP